MQKTAQSCIYSVVGGFCIYIVETLSSTLPYIGAANNYFLIEFLVGIVLGVMIVTMVLLCKKPTLIQMLLRFAVLFLSYIFVTVMNGYIGTIRILYEFFSIKTYSSSDNVSGMLTIMFLSVMVITSIIIMVVQGIVLCFRKKRPNEP